MASFDDNSDNFTDEKVPIEGMRDSNEELKPVDAIIGSFQSLQVATTSATFGSPGSPRYSPGNAGLRPRLRLRELPNSPPYGYYQPYCSPPLIAGILSNRPSPTTIIASDAIAPAFRIMDLPGSDESGYTTSNSNSSLKAFNPVDLPEIDDIGPSGRTEYLPVFPAHSDQGPQLLPSGYPMPNIPDHGPNGCHDCDEIRAQFKEYLLSLHQPGAIKLLEEEEVLEFDREVAEETQHLDPRQMIAVPPNISQFSFDFEIFHPTPPDRSGEFLALGANPELVKLWKSDFVMDVEDSRQHFESRFAHSCRVLELNRERDGDELTDFAQDTLRLVNEVCYTLHLNDLVDSDLEKCRRGEWFLNRDPPSGPSHVQR